MNEKIITVEKTFKEFTSSNSEVKEKKRAEEILKKLNVVKKRMKINTETKIAIQEFLNEKTLSNETTLKLINSKLNEFNNDDSDVEVFENNKKEEQEPEKEEIEKKEEQQEKEPEDEIGKEKPEKEENSGNSKAEELAREGWSTIYVLVKMISWGYVPVLHDEKLFPGKGIIKWVFNLPGYTLLGGPLTNGTINIKKYRKNIKEWFLNTLSTEEKKLRFMLQAVGSNKVIEEINERKKCLEELKNAISTDKSEKEIKKISAKYAKITEKTLTIDDLYNKYNEKKGEKAKKTYEDKIKKEKTNFENEIEKEIKEIDESIKASNKEEEKSKNSLNDDIEDLKEEKINFENDLTKLESEKSNLEKNLTNLEKDKIKLEIQKTNFEDKLEDLEMQKRTTEIEEKINLLNKKIKRNADDLKINEKSIEKVTTNIQNKGLEIIKQKSNINKKQEEIKIKTRELRDFEPTNKKDLEEFNKNKKDLEKLRDVIKNSNYEEFEKILNDNPTLKSKFDKYKDLIEKDHTTIAQEEEKKGKTGTSKKPEKLEAIDNEIKEIEKNVLEIDKEMEKIKKEVETKIKELNNKASMQPNEVPALRADVEKIVEDYNKQATKLEQRGANYIKKLDIKELESFASKSKWTQNFLKVNGGIDKFLSGKAGKVFGVCGIALFGAGMVSMYKEDGGFNEKFKNDIKDMAIGMIPIVGGFYDIGMSFRGKDLNKRDMSTSERLTRFGFGVIGLVPYIGTIVKWSAIVKGGSKAVKISQFGETLIEGGHLIGKAGSAVALGYAGYGTVSYLLFK